MEPFDRVHQQGTPNGQTLLERPKRQNGHVQGNGQVALSSLAVVVRLVGRLLHPWGLRQRRLAVRNRLPSRLQVCPLNISQFAIFVKIIMLPRKSITTTYRFYGGWSLLNEVLLVFELR